MGFFDNLRNAWNSFTGNNYDDEYEDDITYNQNIYSGVNMSSSAPDYSYYEQSYQQQYEQQPEETVDPVLNKDENIVSEIAMVRPSDIEAVRDAATHLIKNRAVVLSLKNTESNLARRWLDFLGGATYAVNGKINRIAPYTYLLTPKGVELVSGFETEA